MELKKAVEDRISHNSNNPSTEDLLSSQSRAGAAAVGAVRAAGDTEENDGQQLLLNASDDAIQDEIARGEHIAKKSTAAEDPMDRLDEEQRIRD